MAEKNWRQTLVICRGDLFGYFLSRPIAIVIAILVIIGLFSPILIKLFSKKAAGQEMLSEDE